MNILRDEIENRRKAVRINRKDLATKAGVSYPDFLNWLNGKKADVSGKTYTKLREALGFKEVIWSEI